MCSIGAHLGLTCPYWSPWRCPVQLVFTHFLMLLLCSPLADDDSLSQDSSRRGSTADWQTPQDNNTSGAGRGLEEDASARAAEDDPQLSMQQRLELMEAKRAKLREIEASISSG